MGVYVPGTPGTTWLLARTVVKGSRTMSILNYFKRSSDLPDPVGPLSKDLKSETIRLVNQKVKPEIDKSQRGERGPYVKLTPSQKALIRKRAAQRGVQLLSVTFRGDTKDAT